MWPAGRMLTLQSLSNILWWGFGLHFHSGIVFSCGALMNLLNPRLWHKVRIIGCAQTYGEKSQSINK